MPTDHQRDDDQQHYRAGRGRRVEQGRVVDRAETTEALWPPLMILTTKKSPITSVMTKIEPKRDARLGQRDHDLSQ